MERPSTEYVPESLVAACAATAMMLVYSAPTPGTGSRYLDGRVAHESKALSVLPVRDALAWSGRRGVGETVLDATLSSISLAGYADPRSAGYLAPLARGALREEPTARVLAGLGHDEIAPFARALEVAGGEEPLGGALRPGPRVRQGLRGHPRARQAGAPVLSFQGRLRPRRPGPGLPRGALGSPRPRCGRPRGPTGGRGSLPHGARGLEGRRYPLQAGPRRDSQPRRPASRRPSPLSDYDRVSSYRRRVPRGHGVRP